MMLCHVCRLLQTLLQLWLAFGFRSRLCLSASVARSAGNPSAVLAHQHVCSPVRCFRAAKYMHLLHVHVAPQPISQLCQCAGCRHGANKPVAPCHPRARDNTRRRPRHLAQACFAQDVLLRSRLRPRRRLLPPDDAPARVAQVRSPATPPVCALHLRRRKAHGDRQVQ